MKKIIIACLLGLILSVQLKAQVFYTTDFVNDREEKNVLYPPSFDVYHRIYELTDTMKYKIYTDSLDLLEVKTIMLGGSSNQYVRGNGSLSLFPTDLSSFTNGPGYINSGGFDTQFSTKSTTNLSEGSNLYFTNSRARSAISLTTTGTTGSATYNNSTGVLNIPNYSPVRTSNPVTHTLVTTVTATGFQISSTSDYNVNYSVYAQVSSALTGNNTADVYLEISSTNSSTPANWTTISRSGILASGVLATSGNTQTVGGFVPAGYYVRIRVAATGANSGTAVFTYQVGQENTY